MPSEQQWEFCQLVEEYSTEEKGQWYYEVNIRYFGEKYYYRQISELKGKNAKPWPYDPWNVAFRFLGASGWELVSVQHSADKYLRWDNKVAYFKRPYVQGRNVDEPKIVFPQNPYG